MRQIYLVTLLRSNSIDGVELRGEDKKSYHVQVQNIHQWSPFLS